MRFQCKEKLTESVQKQNSIRIESIFSQEKNLRMMFEPFLLQQHFSAMFESSLNQFLVQIISARFESIFSPETNL